MNQLTSTPTATALNISIDDGVSPLYSSREHTSIFSSNSIRTDNINSVSSVIDTLCQYCSAPQRYVTDPCGHLVCMHCTEARQREGQQPFCYCGKELKSVREVNTDQDALDISMALDTKNVEPQLAVCAEWAIQNLPFYDLTRFAVAREYAVVRISNVFPLLSKSPLTNRFRGTAAVLMFKGFSEIALRL